MDFTTFITTATVGAVPLVFVIIGLVEYFKKLGVKGNTLLLISMGIGILFGVPYMVSQQRPPAGDWFPIFTYWFAAIVYGIAMGLVASGLYDVVKAIIEKLFGKTIKTE